MRKLSDMTSDERSAYRVWQQRLNCDMSSPEEKAEARRQMDALEWTGTTGPVMSRIGDIEDRLQSIEVLKGNRKFPVTKKEMDKAKDDIVSARSLAETAIERAKEVGDHIESLIETVAESNSGRDDVLIELKNVRDAVGNYSTQIQGLIDNAAKETAKRDREIKALKAENAKIVKALADIVSETIEEAKTAIHAEANSAAIAAVETYMGGK